jgi:hypothetical protein
MESLGLSEAEARKRLKRIGANWAAYITQMYGHDWRRLEASIWCSTLAG